ncbi:MAG: polysaccharide deacetylase family protein [Kiritimatiellaeota bacterium]|nr:polysaccharide deacetylase family protein [Kiritimatiellota bacterium]
MMRPNSLVLALLTAVAAGLTACSSLFPPEDQPPSITRGDPHRKEVLLTFDSGETDLSTQQILDTLAQHHASAAFFLTGQWVERYPELTRRIAAAGHAIYNHSYSHPLLFHAPEAKILAQLRQADAAIERVTGRSSKPYFRPPYGETDANLRRVAWHEGYRLVRWTVNPMDWRPEQVLTNQPKTNATSLGTSGFDWMNTRQDRALADTNAPPDPVAVFATNTVAKIKPGAILMLQLGTPLSGKALPGILTLLQARGYACVPLREGLKNAR